MYRNSLGLGKSGLEVPLAWSRWGIDLGAMSPLDYLEFASDQVAKAVEQAWTNRKPGGMSFGLGQAVVGHNRLTAYTGGNSKMYGSTDQPDFSHIEGYEDHSVNLLYTWNADRELTGVLINVAAQSQVSGVPASQPISGMKPATNFATAWEKGFSSSRSVLPPETSHPSSS